ncbi:hypothetical protein [Pseudomonas sp. PLMAX]|uniref:hypothetical protein n=1 Tax=Pseudomonas sp. PLMAX TaxID=2201998 RepID=UPI0038BC460C
MNRDEFEAVLQDATEEQLTALDEAHWRYMSLIGIVSDVLPAEVVAGDVAKFPEMIKRDDGGLPIFKDADCDEFMVAITGLPREFCTAWKDKDFYELHGESVDDAAASGEFSS